MGSGGDFGDFSDRRPEFPLTPSLSPSRGKGDVVIRGQSCPGKKSGIGRAQIITVLGKPGNCYPDTTASLPVLIGFGGRSLKFFNGSENLLGASLWYVARRLCGNIGGFLALTLYCFSPSMIQSSAVWHTEPEILAAWGAFGAIFTAIAVAHTLYAPREVILWNWRRIVLLGVSVAIAVGSQFSMIIVVPLALAFLLYLAPTTAGWIRRLGGKRWLALHRLIYVTAVAGVVHYYWLVKSDVRKPLFYGALVVLLLALRVGFWLVARRGKPTGKGLEPRLTTAETA